MDGNGNKQTWIVRQPGPWWHRGAAVAALILLVNTLGFAWADNPVYACIALALTVLVGLYDVASGR